MDNSAQSDMDNTEVIIEKHERGLAGALLFFMVTGVVAGLTMIVGAIGGDPWMLVPGLLATLIGIISAIGRVLIDMGRDLKRIYYLD